MKTIDPLQWESLKPELDMIGSKPSRRPKSDLDQLALKLGGYHGPRWLKDRRKQPLRSRRSAQRLITLNHEIHTMKVTKSTKAEAIVVIFALT
jgi:hypothetical protein